MIFEKDCVKHLVTKVQLPSKKGFGMPRSISFDHRGLSPLFVKICPFDSLRRLTMRFNDGFSSDGLYTYTVYAKTDVRFF